jgi:hypothetical protein
MCGFVSRTAGVVPSRFMGLIVDILHVDIENKRITYVDGSSLAIVRAYHESDELELGELALFPELYPVVSLVIGPTRDGRYRVELVEYYKGQVPQ